MPFTSKHSNPKMSNIPEEQEDCHIIDISVSISPISDIEEISDTQSFTEQTGRQDPVYRVDQPMKKKIIQMTDNTMQPVTASVLCVEIKSISDVTSRGTLRIYQGARK